MTSREKRLSQTRRDVVAHLKLARRYITDCLVEDEEGHGDITNFDFAELDRILDQAEGATEVHRKFKARFAILELTVSP